jgi:alkylation response protein AidB-like acyl-CoA dehydrogenase
MDLSLSESQQLLRKSARDFFQHECPKSLVRDMEKDEKGYPTQLWKKMADLGWMGLIVPEKYGGVGGEYLDFVILVEEMGRACLPAPFFSTALGAMFLIEAGTDEQKTRLLSRIASGESIFTLALNEVESQEDPASMAVKATLKGNSYLINGIKLFVPFAHVADYIICVARSKRRTFNEEGITLFLIDGKAPGITCTPLKTIAGDKQSEVVFNNVQVPRENILGQPHRGWPVAKKVLQKAAVAKAAELVGIAQQSLEMAVSYAKERVQFGRPIGSFQAIQHHCANMLIDVDGSKLMTYKAAWMLSEGLPCDIEVAAAKGYASEACRRVTALAHQVFGGIGVIVDHDMPLYYTRAKVAEVAFGDARYHREVTIRRKLEQKMPKSWLLS